MSSDKKKIKTYHTGTWSIPNGKFHLEGKLVIDDDDCAIKLTLYTAKGFTGKDMNDSFDNQSVIFGNCEFDSKITLINCRIKHASPIGDEMYELVYEPNTCYFGGIIADIDRLKICRLTCAFPYFSSWYDTNRNYFGTLSSDNSIGPFEPSIKQSELIDEIEINDGLKIIVERRYDDFNQLFSKEVTHKVEHFVHFVSETPKSLNELKENANIFLQLIKLSIGRLSYAEIKSIIVPKNETIDFDKNLLGKENNVHISISTFNSIQKRRVISSDYIHQNDMLFYGGLRTNNRLKSVIVKWFHVYKDYNPLYNTFLDTLEWFQKTDAFLTDVMFNNRLVNLVQGIEYYYSASEAQRSIQKRNELKQKLDIIIKKIEEKEDKDFLVKHVQIHEVLRHKLKFLIFEKFDIIANEIFKNKEDKKGYIHKIKEFRDKLSHGEMIESPNQKIYDNYYKTLILSVSCILETLGFTNDEILQNLKRTLKYSRIIQVLKLKMLE